MPLFGFEELYQRADGLAQPVPVAVMGGHELSVLQALTVARDRGWVLPVVVGPRTEVERLAGEHDLDLRGFQLIDADNPGPAAVAEVRAGQAAVLMKGRIATPDLMRALLDKEQGLRTGRTIGQAVLMEIGQRRVLLADTGVTIAPDRRQKIEIIQSLVAIARELGVPRPRVAIMSATEKPTPALPDSVEAAELTAAHQQQPLAPCELQGPLTFDLVWDEQAVERKEVTSPVAGAADALAFPELLSANLTVKAMMYTAPCRFGGNLFGVACPVVFMSRADSVATRLNSLALALRTFSD